MRRKPGRLLPLELSILAAGVDLATRGQDEFHGYGVAREIRAWEEARRFAPQGTVYRALDRLEEFGLLESRLEDAGIAEADGRPRRRLYKVTAVGERAHLAALTNPSSPILTAAKGTAST